MASIEFIQKRIEGKEKELATLNKKLERILAAQATNWEKNLYWYSERDIRITEKDIDAVQKSLDSYKAQLVCEEEKAASRDVAVILEFLEGWKARVKDYYHRMYEVYLVEKEEFYRKDTEFCGWYNSNYSVRYTEEGERRYNEHRKFRHDFQARWNFITPYLDNGFSDKKLQKDLDRDANAKYDFIIERTNAIVGQITDASNLRVGEKGDLNGFIIGPKGKAKVETIGAGGYNEDIILDSGRHGQRFHFRTLIHAMK